MKKKNKDKVRDLHSEYSLYLPEKTLLQQKLAEWVEAFEEAQEVLIAAHGRL
jgi:hypothetical protein